MFFRRLFAAALTMLVVTGCAPDTTAPGGDRSQPEAPGLPPLGAQSAQDLRDELIALANYILPNDQSILGKFDALVVAYGAGTGFGDELEDLISKIELEIQKYTQPPRNGSLTDCVDSNTPCTMTVEEFRDRVIANIYRFVGLDPTATICRLPAGHPDVYCEATNPNGDPGAGFVYFPPAIFDQLTFVSIKALNQGVGSGLDEYGFSLEIRTAPISTFGSVRPTVVACVPNNIPDAVLDRMLLGHRRAESKHGENPPFSLLPEADLSEDLLLEGYAKTFCGEPESNTGSSGPSVFGLSADSPLNRLLVGARNLFLPSELAASNAVLLATRGFSGASGSPEEFSTFRAVDRGVTGAGGSPEEFAPQATEGSDATGHQGAAGTSTTTGLPHVIVQTPGGRGVANVLVSFSLSNPSGAGLTPSEASLCLGYPLTVATDANGMATLPCLNFGTKAGFKNLQVTFDPTAVFTGEDFLPGEQPCMIGEGGVCDNDVTANFRIETVAGPATTIEIVEGDGQTAAAYTAVAIAPKVVVKDQYGNVVAGKSVAWSANVGTIVPNNGDGLEDAGATITGADGTSALTSWTLGAGSNTLLAEITTAGDPESVTFNATGTFGLSLDNACVTGGQKDDITKHRFYFPHSPNRAIQAIGINLSSNGAPGQSENYEVTLVATRELGQQGQNQAVTESRTVTARLQSGSNASKGAESEVIFDFGTNPLPARGHNAGSGRVTVQMSVVQIINGVSMPLSGNRVVNMNAGSCPAGQLNCNQNQRRVPAARTCDQTESQIGPPLIENFRRAFAGRVYTSP